MEENRMLSDEILLALIKKNSGGGGGTSDYNQLENQPQIGGNTLVGNKTASELGLADSDTVSDILNGTNIDSFGDVETALEDKQGVLMEGDYVSIDARNNISVNRELTPHQTSYRIKGIGQYTMNITKYIDGVEDSSTDYGYSQGTTRTIDDAFTINDTYSSDGYIWQFVWLRDSTTHDKDYTVSYRAYNAAFDFTEVFNDEDLSGYKLVIKSEMDAALADKQDKSDNNLQTTDKTVVGGINELKSGLTDLSNYVDGDATTYPYADVITVEDAIPANLKACSVKVEPVQDLHGYDKPWVGGAGKNKLPLVLADIKTINTAGTWNDNTYTVNGLTFTILTDDGDNIVGIKVTGIANAQTIFRAGVCTLTAETSVKFNGITGTGSGSTYSINMQIGSSYAGEVYSGDSVTHIIPANTNTTYLCVLYSGYECPTEGLMFYPMIRLATETDATFAPYTNICPISGHTEAVVTREGVNIFNPNALETFDVNGEGVIRTGHRFREVKKYIVNNINNGNIFGRLVKTDLSEYGQYVTILPNTYASFTVTEGYMLYVYYEAVSGMSAENICVKYGDDTTFIAYEGQQYTLALGDTIYGGTVDFDSGVMTVDRAIVDMGTLTWTQASTAQTGKHSFSSTGISDSVKRPTSTQEVANIICSNTEAIESDSIYNCHNGVAVSVSGVLYYYGETYSTMNTSDFTTAVTGQTLCYELATPFTVQLTPQQIQLLQGTNTLYASTGDISVSVNGVSGAIGAIQSEVNEITGNVADLQGALSTLKVYAKWAQSITVPKSLCTFIMFGGLTGGTLAFTYNAESDTLTGIDGATGITATLNSDDTVTFATGGGYGTFAIYVV